ncbi:MAG: RNA polymerase sigma factor [Rikenellaceae bacterium]
MREDKDNDILELIAKSSTRMQGFEALVIRYQEPIYWHIRRLVVSHEDAQDVMQECFINIHKYIDKFKHDSSLKTWVYKIATNEAIRHFNKNKLDLNSYDNKTKLIEVFEAEEEIDFSSMEAKLQKALLSLPEKQRVTFNLRHYEQMNYEQIAEVTSTSVATLKTNYHYAITKIKDYMLKQL